MRSISPIHEHVSEKMQKFAAPVAFNGPIKSSTWPIIRHDEGAAPLPGPSAQANMHRNNENVPLVPRRTPPQQNTVSSSSSGDEDSSDDETFDSADEEPQPPSSPTQYTEPKASSMESRHSPSRPPNFRANSAAYWAQDAWRDQVTQQVGSAVQRMREERDAASLRPGVSRQHSGISDVSVLTSEANTTSDGSRPGTRSGR